MIQHIDGFLQTLGYQMIPSDLPEFTIFFKVENTFVNVLHYIDYKCGLYIGSDQYEHVKEKIYDLFREKGFTEIHLLSLIAADDTEKAKRLCAEDNCAWLLAPGERKLLIYENQVPDFYGLRGLLERWLEEELEEQKPEKKEVRWKSLSWVTIGLIIVNIVVFIICTFTGELLYNIGELEVAGIVGRGEYYRFFTSLFLHGGIQHLFNNMFLLYFVGDIVEREVGKAASLSAYLLSGVGGGILSLAFDIWSGQYYGSIGASGAIFGIMGVLLVLTALHRGRLQSVTLPRLIFMILYSLSMGFTSTTTDNAAHIGGFVTGVAVGMIIGLMKRVFRSRKELQ